MQSICRRKIRTVLYIAVRPTLALTVKPTNHCSTKGSYAPSIEYLQLACYVLQASSILNHYSIIRSYSPALRFLAISAVLAAAADVLLAIGSALFFLGIFCSKSGVAATIGFCCWAATTGRVAVVAGGATGGATIALLVAIGRGDARLTTVD